MSARTALILAGSRGPGDPLAQYAGVTHKALIEVGGRSMLARVVAAVREAGYERIGVVIETAAPVEALKAAGELPEDVEVLAAEAGPSASVAAGLARYGAPLLVTTADHALLRPEWIAHFVAHVPAEASIAAGLARSEAVTAAAPEGKRTFLRFSDGAYSGCNLFYLADARAAGVVRLWQEVEALRKQPVRLLGRLGPVTAMRYALGMLSLRSALARLGQLTGAVAAVVEMPFGEAAIDVDKPEDLVLVRRMVEG